MSPILDIQRYGVVGWTSPIVSPSMHSHVLSSQVEAMAREIFDNGPIACTVSIRGSRSFQLYRGGILRDDLAGADRQRERVRDHSLILTGFGGASGETSEETSEETVTPSQVNGSSPENASSQTPPPSSKGVLLNSLSQLPFWIGRNTYGTGWGESGGWFRLQKGANAFGVESPPACSFAVPHRQDVRALLRGAEKPALSGAVSKGAKSPFWNASIADSVLRSLRRQNNTHMPFGLPYYRPRVHRFEEAVYVPYGLERC